MSKIKTYLYTIAITTVIVAAAFIIPISSVKSFCLSCFGFTQNNIVLGVSSLCAFVFLGNKNYWFIITGCAIVTALVIQLVIVGHNVDIMTLIARITAFMIIVFLMNFVRVLVNRA